MVLNEQDKEWARTQERLSYVLPPKAGLFWRLPVIRRIRWSWLTVQAEKQASEYADLGIGLGHLNPYDCWVLYALFRGWC